MAGDRAHSELEIERQQLTRARAAVESRLKSLSEVRGGGADVFAEEYIAAVVRGAVEKLQQDLVVFGRIDDDRAWRVGLYGIDEAGDQLVIDWRAPFAQSFYQASVAEPMGLERRISYVGAIDDLLIEEFTTGEVRGSSPLMKELSRSRGAQMKAAVATLQSEQDELVRLDPDRKLVLRGGPGTGKTVVGLHRAAWLVYNDTRLTAGQILVVGPSDKFLQYIATVMPTLGEARIKQTTFERLLGPSTPAGGDIRWTEILDRYEANLLKPAEVKVGIKRIRLQEITETMERVASRDLPWKDRRKIFVNVLANKHHLKTAEVGKAVAGVWPARTQASALKDLRRRKTLEELGAEPDLIDTWLADPVDGGVIDEIRARFAGVPALYGHVIVDEAQDLDEFQLRAVQRRSNGITLVGDDAQKSSVGGIGLRSAGERLGVGVSELTTAYRMSAEIADWLNYHATQNNIDSVELVGIRATGVQVVEVTGGLAVANRHYQELGSRWPNVAVITADDVWTHKGVEYDAVVVITEGMSPAQIYLGASRAAHELVIATQSVGDQH